MNHTPRFPEQQEFRPLSLATGPKQQQQQRNNNNKTKKKKKKNGGFGRENRGEREGKKR